MKLSPLTRTLGDLEGLRSARWVRASSQGQRDLYVPRSDGDNFAALIQRCGLVETGLVFTASDSGRTVRRSSAMQAMIDSARAGDFDVLLTSELDRLGRCLRGTVEVVDDLHLAGVSLVVCDRGLVSSDPSDWETIVRGLWDVEGYSQQLSRKIRDGYRAKRARVLQSERGDPAA